MSMSYHLVPVDVLECPQRGGFHDVLLDRHWAFVPFQGLVFAKLNDRDFFPQCNDSQPIASLLTVHIRDEYPDVETLFVPRAFVPVVDRRGELGMTLPQDRGYRAWDVRKVR